MYGTIFWGIILILLGVLLILEHVGLLDMDLWELWPVIFIFIGLNMLFRPRKRIRQKARTSTEGGD
jgi:membrane protein DedA with SNARE-associated domain